VRVLLDECLPHRLKRELVGYDVKTAPEMGWASKANGELARARSWSVRCVHNGGSQSVVPARPLIV
jgi:hypothetical protein